MVYSKVLQMGYPELTQLCGNGGLPSGRLMEIFGASNSGKTKVALRTIALAQSSGKTCLYIDTEHRFSGTYAASLGVDLSTLAIIKDSSEDVLDVLIRVLTEDCFDLIVIDSIAGLTPPAQYVSHIGEWLEVKLNIVRAHLRVANTSIICINQLRSQLRRGDTSTNYKAMDLFSSIRLKLERHGSSVTAKVLKNRLAPTFGEASFTL